MKKIIMLGAVAYDAKVVPIWDIIRDYYNDNNLRLDYVLFSNYEAQVEALNKGMIDVAWNTKPIALFAHGFPVQAYSVIKKHYTNH